MKGFDKALIAPCGINCGTCLAYLRNKNKCAGCRTSGTCKPKHCVQCSILNCPFLAETSSKFCYDCQKYPCTRLKQLDRRYRTKYKTSLIGNLEKISTVGLEIYIKMEDDLWRCRSCGGTICVHRGFCINCNAQRS